MNDTALWALGATTKPAAAAEKPSAAKWGILAATFILVIGLCASTWMYFQETQLSRFAAHAGAGISATAAEANALLQKQFDRWAFWVVVGSAGGGTGFLLAIVLGLRH